MLRRIGDMKKSWWVDHDKVKYYWHADCGNCPFGWETRGYEGECYDDGCYAHDSKLACYLPRWIKRLIKRIKRWEE